MTMVIFIFIFTYFNAVLIAVVTSSFSYKDDIIQYGQQILISIIVQSILPYV